MRFTIRNLLAITAALAICVAFVTDGLPWLARQGVSFHQHGVTLELIEWGNEYSAVHDRESAIRAAEMIGYIANYYVPSDGYRSTSESERELESARAKSLRQLVTALECYTGFGFGDDYSRWSQWADSQKQLLQRQKR